MKRYPPHAIRQARRLRREMTGPERRLWAELRKLGLNFRRQVPIGRYIADFACLGARLVVEVDGGWHELPEKQLHDAVRDTWFAGEGYRVLRFRDQQVLEDREAVVDAILATLPPRGGKGRDGGVRADLGSMNEGGAASSAPPDASCTHPHPCPSPLEGEG